MAKRIRKFEPDSGFADLNELVEWCMVGGWIFWGPTTTRPIHGSVLMNQQCRVVVRHLPGIRRAVIREEWKAAHQQVAIPEYTRIFA